MIERHYSPRELAELTGLREGTLAQWRSRQNKRPGSKPSGPKWRQLGRSIRYAERDVLAWLAEREVQTAK
jgi:predicted DNA-binding transcriptional regulator AlpA